MMSHTMKMIKCVINSMKINSYGENKIRYFGGWSLLERWDKPRNIKALT